jgi:hypothetical protein
MNAFERYGETHRSPHEKRRERIAIRRRASAAMRKQREERDKRERLYRAGMERLVEEFVAEAGEKGRELIKLLDRLTVNDATVLLQRATVFERSPPGLRLMALHLTSRAIVAARERAGLPPFDDRLDSPLADEAAPQTVFDRIKHALTGESP